MVFENSEKDEFSKKIIIGLRSVTKKLDEEKYEDFIQRAKKK